MSVFYTHLAVSVRLRWTLEALVGLGVQWSIWFGGRVIAFFLGGGVVWFNSMLWCCGRKISRFYIFTSWRLCLLFVPENLPSTCNECCLLLNVAICSYYNNSFNFMLITSWEIQIGNNCALGFEYCSRLQS